MPGNFFNFNNNNNNRRRKRSLLGRKNHSENDLPRQGELVVLPENLKTVLLAGTPECWSLSSSNAVVTQGSPQDCDASLLSYASSSMDWESPRMSTTSSVVLEENEELRHNAQQFHQAKKTQRRNSASFWQRFNTPNGSLHKKSYSDAVPANEVGSFFEERQQPEQQENSVTTEPNSAIVMNPPTAGLSPSLPAQEALNMWCK